METINYPSIVTAIKEHKCDYCLMAIEKGTKYIKSVYKFEGTIYAWKSHSNCQNIAHKLGMFQDCEDGVTSDDFQETIHCQHDQICGDATGLSFADKLQFLLAYHGLTPITLS